MKRFLLIVFFLSSLIAVSQDLSQNLLLDYEFDGNTNDSSGNNYDGTPFGVTYGPDRYGNPTGACYFNGIDNYVNFPNVSALKPQLPVSFSFLINYQSEDYHQQVVFNTSFEENHCTGIWYNSSLANNAHAINFGDGTYAYSPETRRTLVCYKEIVINTWRRVTVVVNSATDMKIYIDCESDPGQYTGEGGSLAYSSTPGCIGRHDRDLTLPPDYFKGYIDQFKYWDRALTPEDIAILCANDLSVVHFASAAAIKISPIPAGNRVDVVTEENFDTMHLTNSVGQQVFNGAFTQSIDVSAFPAGLYFLTCRNKESSETVKVLVTH